MSAERLFGQKLKIEAADRDEKQSFIDITLVDGSVLRLLQSQVTPEIFSRITQGNSCSFTSADIYNDLDAALVSFEEDGKTFNGPFSIGVIISRDQVKFPKEIDSNN